MRRENGDWILSEAERVRLLKLARGMLHEADAEEMFAILDGKWTPCPVRLDGKDVTEITWFEGHHAWSCACSYCRKQKGYVIQRAVENKNMMSDLLSFWATGETPKVPETATFDIETYRLEKYAYVNGDYYYKYE